MDEVAKMISLIKYSNIDFDDAYKTVLDQYFSIIFDIIDDPQFHIHLDDIIRIYHLEDSIKQFGNSKINLKELLN
jgi:hypothetical protein